MWMTPYLLPPVDGKSLAYLKILLWCFELLSGLQINYGESSIYKLGSSTEESFDSAATILTCQMGTFPMNYLGLPIKPWALSRSGSIYLIRLIAASLVGKVKASREEEGLLLSIRFLPPSCSIICHIPSWVIDHIDRTWHDFFCKESKRQGES